MENIYKNNAREIVKSLTLKQKIGQLNQEPLTKDNSDELKKKSAAARWAR